MLWHDLKRAIRTSHHKNIAEPKGAKSLLTVVRVWSTITGHICWRLLLLKLGQTVMEFKGSHTFSSPCTVNIDTVCSVKTCFIVCEITFYAEIQAIIGKNVHILFPAAVCIYSIWVNFVFVSSASCHTWCGIACPLKEETCFTSNLPQYRSICVPCCAGPQKHWADFYAGGIQWHLCHQLISRQDSLLIKRRKSWHTMVQEGKKKGRKRKMQCNFF